MNDSKQQEGWQQIIAEDWIIEMNAITPQLLQKFRLILLVAYPIKKIEIECDPNKFIMKWDCYFKFWGSLFRKKKMVKQIHSKLAEKFKNYEITVNSL